MDEDRFDPNVGRNVNAPARLQPAGADTEGVIFDVLNTLLVRVATAMKTDDNYTKDTLLGPHVRDYLRYVGRRRRDRTVDSYEETLAFLCWEFRGTELNEITYDDLDDYIYRRWGAGGRKKNGEPFKPATERQRIAAIKGFFKWADEIAERIDGKNPARKLEPPQLYDEDTEPRRAHPDDVIETLLNGQPKLRDRIALQLQSGAAFRRNETRLFQLKHFTSSTHALRVQHGKGGKSRTVYTTSQLQIDLDWYIDLEGHGPEEYVLYPWRKFNQPFRPTSMHDWFQSCLKRAGFEPGDILMHELRYTAATNFYNDCRDIERTRRFLGHSDTKTTQRYLDLTDDEMRETLGRR
jgi:site-specific recombinase XerD